MSSNSVELEKINLCRKIHDIDRMEDLAIMLDKKKLPAIKLLSAGNYKILRELNYLKLESFLHGAGVMHYCSSELKCFNTGHYSHKDDYSFDNSYGNRLINSIESRNLSDFCYIIHKIHYIILGRCSGFRKKSVGIGIIDGNYRTEFPHYTDIMEGIDLIFYFCSKLTFRNRMLWPFCVYIMIINIHPFEDGNGRVARAMFNIIYSELIDGRIIMPFYEIDRCSGKSVTMNVRQAIIYGEWFGIVDIFLKYISSSEIFDLFS